MLRGILIFVAGVVVGAAGGGGYGYKLLQDAGDDIARISASHDATKSQLEGARKQSSTLENAKAAAEQALAAAEKKLNEFTAARQSADRKAAELQAQLDAANKAKGDLEAQIAVTRSAPQPPAAQP